MVIDQTTRDNEIKKFLDIFKHIAMLKIGLRENKEGFCHENE